MAPALSNVKAAIGSLAKTVVDSQQNDGTWRYCFNNATIIDAYVIILFRTLYVQNEELIKQLHDRILAEQQPDGGWRLYPDEDGGNLSASIDAYYALLYSGYSTETDEQLQRAKRYILSKGGIGKVSSALSKGVLAATGQIKWPASITSIPLEVLLFPDSFPISFFDFSGYARVHLAPMLIMADRRFSIKTEQTPDLSELQAHREQSEDIAEQPYEETLGHIQMSLSRLIGSPRHIHEVATVKAEQFMLQRIESDGTLYTYASSTILMIFSLLALGYDREHPVIAKAVSGIEAMRCSSGGSITIQNSPSTVWDTALMANALLESGTPVSEPVIQRAAQYLLNKQQTKYGDWSIHNPGTQPGGWGFSETNTLYPDLDDTTASLRVLQRLYDTDPAYSDAYNRGLQWVVSMQNKDGGWPAFEKDTNKKMLTWLVLEGAKSAAIDPSEADLTGRTLEYLGEFAELDNRHSFVKRGTSWLIRNQEKNGSWYGRWGICYIYGTWAALTGLTAAGFPFSHEAVRKGAHWLLSIQNDDGGWGESCSSDKLKRYVPLGASTPSQTAWAIDALVAVHPKPTAEINKGVTRLIELLSEDDWASVYPTGAGLPGAFYIHYESYRYIWPLLALGHYYKKYGAHLS